MKHCSRRQFLRAAAHAASLAAIAGPLGRAAAALQTHPAPAAASIDRKALVTRHNIVLEAIDLLSPLQVGNGEFAFTCDVTGLQTLAEAHRPRMPLNTMAQWAWHATPNTEGFCIDQLARPYDVGEGRKVPYCHDGDFSKDPAPAGRYLRRNPHRLSLARIALVGRDGAAIAPEALTGIRQSLDLWTGIVSSRFDFLGKSVEVTTVAHPTRDLVAFRINAAGLLAAGDLAVRIAFPAAQADWRNPDGWDAPDAHTTLLRAQPRGGATFERRQDGASYAVRAAWREAASLAQAGPQAFDLRAQADWIELVVEFAPAASDATTSPTSAPAATNAATATTTAPATLQPLPPVADVLAAATRHWQEFWSSGAAIDFADCTDVRAPELERRIVLSQYLTAVNCAGSAPPQASGLLFNSWYGKQPLDLHWWSGAHFAMWGRLPLLERSLAWYGRAMPQARATAERQGYEGVRWPRLCGPDGAESPSEIGSFVIWQQPHPIYFAEQAYRAQPTRETLDRYGELVEQTARFMASYARLDEKNKRYVLGPALVPAQETYWPTRAELLNPTFELAYWVWGLGVAQKWRERLGKPPEEKWAAIIDKLSKPLIREGRYAAIETAPHLENDGHPSFLQALGFVPRTHLIDENVMRETARWTKAKWKWNAAAGWDFAVLAQTATRLGETELAVDALLMESEKNRFLAGGHNFQIDNLPAYLPGNGALLAAIALMAGGWDGGPDTPAPGFPKNGKWNVRCEGFARVI